MSLFFNQYCKITHFFLCSCFQLLSLQKCSVEYIIILLLRHINLYYLDILKCHTYIYEIYIHKVYIWIIKLFPWSELSFLHIHSALVFYGCVASDHKFGGLQKHIFHPSVLTGQQLWCNHLVSVLMVLKRHKHGEAWLSCSRSEEDSDVTVVFFPFRFWWNSAPGRQGLY
jgi:hypothetical protein